MSTTSAPTMIEQFSSLWAQVGVEAVDQSLPDAALRARVLDDLDHTLFVEAGAGSGKTSILVGRVVALIAAGIPVTTIAAITFTDKAAAELHHRIRSVLTCFETQKDVSVEVADRCRTALDELDHAAIGTLHSFAQRLLSEHPLEAGLPPRVEVLDEIESELAFNDRWRDFLDQLLDDPASGMTVVLAFALGVKLPHLRDLARLFADNWDLVAERVPLDPDPIGLLDVGSPVAELRRICAPGVANPELDPLAEALAAIDRWLDQLEESSDDVARIEQIRASQSLFALANKGRARNWPDAKRVRDDVAKAKAGLEAAVDAVRQQCLAHLAATIADFTARSVGARRVEGRLDFHDLLVLARQLLRDSRNGTRVRKEARARHAFFLLDEFQDTDPIQIELAARLAAPPDQEADDWSGLDPEPGRLFIVGDPKQSIYRFRRADIDLFLSAADRFGPASPLTTNFRSTEPVVAWINHAFGRLIHAEPHAQPAYVALDAVRSSRQPGAAITMLGAHAHESPDGERLSADDLRQHEADDVAAVIGTIRREGWLVGDGRAASLADITVLLPARTALAALERALDGASIAYRAVSSSLVYTTPEVRELLLAARAVDDPSDELALVATLRSRLFGCSDADLYEWKAAGGRFDLLGRSPAALAVGQPVHDAVTELGELASRARLLAPSELLDELCVSRRLFELAMSGSRARDVWRRLRFVIDQARAWSEAGGGTTRAYLRWAAQQATEGTRVAEAVLPETDDDAVQIMTIHAAKGLQFPITIVAGLTTDPKRRTEGATVLWAGGRCEIKIGTDAKTAHFDEAAALDEQLSHYERLRLLYVGCTRAQDHLVVSAHRRARAASVPPEKMTLAELVAESSEGAGHHVFAAIETSGPPVTSATESAPFPFAEFDDWAAEHARVVARARRPHTIGATALAAFGATSDDAGLMKGPRNLDLPAWNRGRYGTAVGKAVHGVLQTIDFHDDTMLYATAAAQAAAEGVHGREDLIAALVRSALASPVVQRAASRPHWREVYVAAPAGPTTIEGYIDLLYRDRDGLVVIDFKTDQVSGPLLEARLARYGIQIATYALAVERTTGERVVRAVLLQLRAEGAAVEHEVGDLSAARAEVERRLTALSGR